MLQNVLVVVLNNLSSHKNQEVRDLIKSVGTELWFLPPYSPDLNPIEKMWSKIKAILRKLKAQTEQTQYYKTFGSKISCKQPTAQQKTAANSA